MSEGKTLVATMVEVFKKPNQPAGEFLKELKELTPEDRIWYMQELIKAGYKITQPTV